MTARTNSRKKAVPQFKWLAAGFPLRRPGFDPRSGHVGFKGGHIDTGARCLRVFPFPLPVIPPTAPHSSSSSEAGTTKQWPMYQADLL
jgi:hypothetical protein